MFARTASHTDHGFVARLLSGQHNAARHDISDVSGTMSLSAGSDLTDVQRHGVDLSDPFPGKTPAAVDFRFARSDSRARGFTGGACR